ncbi:MAG TPA: glycosyltransferase family 2 protein [Candidatus Paceibacterota bacterium]|nr:glycosyltransferase family 2 protein [Candidatus Paceibacterota bacterium]
MSDKPLISVIIPVYNCEKTIAAALDSILRQTYDNLEVIVVDDASTDGTKKAVEAIAAQDSRAKLLSADNDPERFDAALNRNVNAGWSARNTGLREARGAYITFQDADDASFLNRIELQYSLLKKHGSTHLTIDWIQFDQDLVGKKAGLLENPEVIGPDALYAMSQRSKGFVAKISTRLNRIIPFHWKRKRIVNKLFFGSLENYPAAGNSPLFERTVIEKVVFRKLRDRVWPSFMGRGADKDFNFHVAETFRNSHVVLSPLYMWRVKDQNPRYLGGIKEIIM